MRCYDFENQQRNVWLITRMTSFNRLSVWVERWVHYSVGATTTILNSCVHSQWSTKDTLHGHRDMCQRAGEILPGSANVGESPSLPWSFPDSRSSPLLTWMWRIYIQLLCGTIYTGPKKVKPPRLSNNFGQPFEDVCILEESKAQLMMKKTCRRVDRARLPTQIT